MAVNKVDYEVLTSGVSVYTNRHLRMQGMQSRVFLISFRITCRTDRMMMHRVQQQYEANSDSYADSYITGICIGKS